MICMFLLLVLVNLNFEFLVRNAGGPRHVVWHLDGFEESKNVTLERSQNYMIKPGTRSLEDRLRTADRKKKKSGTF